MEGLKLATVYGLMPHEMGFCGPQLAASQRILRGFLVGKNSSKEAQDVLEKFEGAYPYYQLIAQSNEIDDPFDERVVRAYWIGSELLDNVSISDLRQTVIEKFSYPGLLSKEIAQEKAEAIPNQAKPHHSFHVYIIGSVTGVIDLSDLGLKNLCRVSWGKVLEIKDDNILMEYQSVSGEKELKLGEKKTKNITWDKDVLPELKIGDWISTHWNLAVQILSEDDIKNLEKYTLLNISK